MLQPFSAAMPGFRHLFPFNSAFLPRRPRILPSRFLMRLLQHFSATLPLPPAAGIIASASVPAILLRYLTIPPLAFSATIMLAALAVTRGNTLFLLRGEPTAPQLLWTLHTDYCRACLPLLTLALTDACAWPFIPTALTGQRIAL